MFDLSPLYTVVPDSEKIVADLPMQEPESEQPYQEACFCDMNSITSECYVWH